MTKQRLYKEVNLWRCEPGDVLLRRDGWKVPYDGFSIRHLQPHSANNGHRHHSNGYFYFDVNNTSDLDIIAILAGRGRTR